MQRDRILFEAKSKHFFYESDYSHHQDHMFYAHMFLEDMGNSIMPIGGKRYSEKPFEILVSSPEEQIKAKINLLFPSEYHNYDFFYSPLEEVVSGFIEDTAKRLIVGGTQYYEIIPALINSKYSQDELNLAPPLFVLQNIPGRVLKIGNVYIQMIPRKLWSKINKKFIIIPSSSVWRIEIPKQMGGRKVVKQTLDGLFIAGGKKISAYKLFEESLTSRKDNFDVTSYYRRAEAYVAWLTRAWGWDIRFSLQRYATDYYLYYRRIISAYMLAVFREHIFKEMNTLLGKIGYGFQMSMNGLPSSNEILTILTKLKAKEFSFEEVHEFTDIS